MRGFLIYAFFMIVSAQASASPYKISHQDLDILFASAEVQEISSVLQTSTTLDFRSDDDTVQVQDGRNAIPAFLLAFFLGPTGLHRAYLGTRSQIVLGYLVTCGGCGILWAVDSILLLIGVLKEDVEQYTDNPKFFMW